MRTAAKAAERGRSSPKMDAAARALRGEAIRRLRIEWKEDVRIWHPGATWMWDAAGFGVFDPGINALSILTRIAPHPVFVTSAELSVPSNKQTPIRAELTLATGRDAPEDLKAFFDWGHTGDESWTIAIETHSGRRLELEAGGSRLKIDGVLAAEGPSKEYPAIYRHFAAALVRFARRGAIHRHQGRAADRVAPGAGMAGSGQSVLAGGAHDADGFPAGLRNRIVHLRVEYG